LQVLVILADLFMGNQTDTLGVKARVVSSRLSYLEDLASSRRFDTAFTSITASRTPVCLSS